MLNFKTPPLAQPPVSAPEGPRSNSTEFLATPPAAVLSDEVFQAVETQIITSVNGELGAKLTSANINDPDPALKQQVEGVARRVALRLLSERRIADAGALQDRLAQSVLNKLLGYGWLEALLPPALDVIEIMLNPDGTLWVVPRGANQAQRVTTVAPSPADAQLVIGKILAGANRRVTEAEPRVDARLPRTPRLPTGARVHVIIPQIAVGDYPALNLRFYEPEPVRPEKIVAWGALSRQVFDFLAQAVRCHARIMIAGGTSTGKTTLLSALGNFIPPDERIVTIEDTVEIFLDHPHVVTLEARPPSMEGKYGVTMGHLVVDAMRMTPRWLIVGEIRTGAAATALFSAQMSDHPGLSTTHAESPAATLERLSLLIQTDEATARIRPEAIKKLVTASVDLLVQIQVVDGVRRVTQVVEIGPQLAHGDVYLTDLWRFDAASTTWQQVGATTRTRA